MATILRIVPRLLAVLCLLALLPWTLGIPGTDNAYARGWSIGFYAIILYLVFFSATVLLRSLRRWLPVPTTTLDYLRFAAVAAFMVAQFIAWPLILS
ncbi:MAG TPA: hypothetical protein VIL88_17690 [Devosia sp.]|jgi:hypothetical protein|uniref:hypothetical protein n=1 Tax=Devosia sp. TaxID=1871048 RepID=UPI002F93F515